MSRDSRPEQAVERLEPAVIPDASDREEIRTALAVLSQVPVSEITDSVLDEAIRRIEADAVADAERVIVYVDRLIEHLQSINCTSEQDVIEYFDAEHRVLSELYAELQQPHPSPTRVHQLAIQYALDPRRVINAASHQMDIRRITDGFEIVVLSSGQVRFRSIPYPGRIIRHSFAVQLLDLILRQSWPITAIMQLIEMLLEKVPSAGERPTPSLTSAPAKADIQADVTESCVTVLGRSFVVDLQLVHFVQALLVSPGSWVSSTQFSEDPLFKSVRIDRLIKKLPASVKDLIEGRPGAGYRLCCERLAELRQKSSVATPSEPAEDTRQRRK